MSKVDLDSKILPRCSSRVCLRRLTGDDLEDFQAYRLDPEVAALQGWNATSDEQALEFLNKMETAVLWAPTQWCQLGIADPVSNKLLGDIGLCVCEDGTQLEFGISLNRAMQGQGIASAALSLASALVFEHSRIERMVAITDVRNFAAQSLLTSCGFAEIERIETTFRDKPCIEIVYELYK